MLRHEAMTPEEVEVQKGLDRSWAAARATLEDPTARAELERSIERINNSNATVISKDEFLAQTEPAE